MADLYFNAKINEALVFYVTLMTSGDDDTPVTNPTLAAGDARTSLDGGAFGNLATIPAVDPAGDVAVKVSLSAGELNGANCIVVFEDQTAAEEWQALTITIHTHAVDIDDLVRSTTPANTLDVSAGGEAGVDWANVGTPGSAVALANTTVSIVSTLTGHTVQTGDSFARLAAPAGASVSADIAANQADLNTIITDTTAIVADTNELQTDWANGGRLDLLIDLILADTGELQGDWVNGGRLDLLIDLILADTGELQTDWVNGGRLDLLIDAILADTGTTGVQVDFTQAYTEGQAVRTLGGALEVLEASERNRLVDTGVGGNRTVYQSDDSTVIVTRAHTATELS